MTPRRPAAAWPVPSAIAVAACALALDAAAAALAWAEHTLAALVLHLLLCAAMLALAWGRRGALSAAAATLRLGAMLMPALGPLAGLAVLLVLLVDLVVGDPETDPRTWYDHLFPRIVDDHLAVAVDDAKRRGLAAARADDVASFHDVLRWGTPAEREHVLILVGRGFRPDFAPVLRQAIASDDPGLRAQSAAALSLLEARASTRLAELRAAQRASASAQAAVTLAQTLADTAHSGLYDQTRSREMREEIISLLNPVFDRGHDPALGAAIGRTLLQLGQTDRAIAVLRRALDAAPDNLSAFSWLLEAHYRRRDYAQLAAALAQHPRQTERMIALDSPLAPTLKLWLEPA